MSGYRLLIVDDDPTDRRIIAEALAQIAPDTCRIQLAADGVAALAALRTDEFDCLLLDYNLPDMNALEFLTAAAVDGEQPCAVVLVTGQGNEAVAVEAMKRGVQDYLVKDQVNAESPLADFDTRREQATATTAPRRLAVRSQVVEPCP